MGDALVWDEIEDEKDSEEDEEGEDITPTISDEPAFEKPLENIIEDSPESVAMPMIQSQFQSSPSLQAEPIQNLEQDLQPITSSQAVAPEQSQGAIPNQGYNLPEYLSDDYEQAQRQVTGYPKTIQARPPSLESNPQVFQKNFQRQNQISMPQQNQDKWDNPEAFKPQKEYEIPTERKKRRID